jgi:hypothetical protein
MAKSNSRTEVETTSTSSQDTSFPVPFSVEEFHFDVLTLYVHHVAKSDWFIRTDRVKSIEDQSSQIWQLFIDRIPSEPGALYSSGTSAREIGVTYDDIRLTPFAERLDVLYQYAFFGNVDMNKTAIESEGDYSWIAALVCDCKDSFYMQEWDDYGNNVKASAENCFSVVELANARWQLENGENFSHLGLSPTNESSGTGDELTIRQMALLAGMEEMSIRAAANPKRSNPLVTFSVDGKTRVTAAAAKSWLISKNRYVPIQYQFSAGEFDLAKRKFSDFDDFLQVAKTRLFFLQNETQDARKLESNLAELTTIYLNDFHWISDPVLVRNLSEHLKLPPELFALRLRQLQASEELKAVERELSTSFGVQN